MATPRDHQSRYRDAPRTVDFARELRSTRSCGFSEPTTAAHKNSSLKSSHEKRLKNLITWFAAESRPASRLTPTTVHLKTAYTDWATRCRLGSALFPPSQYFTSSAFKTTLLHGGSRYTARCRIFIGGSPEDTAAAAFNRVVHLIFIGVFVPGDDVWSLDAPPKKRDVLTPRRCNASNVVTLGRDRDDLMEFYGTSITINHSAHLNSGCTRTRGSKRQ